MKRVFLPYASLALCWTLSPDALVHLGNGFGRHGKIFGLALLAGAWISAAAAYILHHPVPATVGDDRQHTITGGIGVATVAVNLAGRISPALLFSTGMLVTAGFTFNETFVYWFPNFGFSFLLLLLVLILHLGGERVVIGAQQVFFLLTSFCLLFLALAGILTGPTSPHPTEALPAGTGSAFLALVPLAMLFFPGYDQRLPDDGGNRYYPAVVGIGFLILSLWGLASLAHVPQARLAESSVSYVVGAKAILGQPGRLIMGIAIISGTCGAVNGLFYLAVGTVQQLVPENVARQPAARKRYGWLPRIQAMLMALLIAMFLAFGLAGSDKLKVYIFGALLLWLLAIGANCLAAGMRLSRQRKRQSSLGYVTGGLIFAAVAYLAFTYPEQQLLAAFCLSVLIAGGVFSAMWSRSTNPAINTQGDKQ